MINDIFMDLGLSENVVTLKNGLLMILMILMAY